MVSEVYLHIGYVIDVCLVGRDACDLVRNSVFFSENYVPKAGWEKEQMLYLVPPLICLVHPSISLLQKSISQELTLKSHQISFLNLFRVGQGYYF